MITSFSNEKPNERMGKVTQMVLESIIRYWPANPFEVARSLGENGNNKSLSSKYLYHFRKLKKMEMIEMKRTGNTYIAWPTEMERLRVIHDLLKV